ncbi:hypothetical protein J2741_001422 [Methanolinea mesophila]|uniref:hypothetical protein n=1 Tax=Methanolinea mesophila TaxID=547055 RepID=UPI001AE5FFC1|nr:hypothetical protein [Methanolinea mesophila]MBP1928875.1 hypothetical protein [Methanolinea mesophila]
MENIRDQNIESLYLIAKRACCDIGIECEQREAVHLLGEIARQGNKEADTALHMLFRAPFLHPLLREMVASDLTT